MSSIRQRCGVTRAQAGEDGSPGCGILIRVSWAIERGHGGMAAIPTMEEDARCPSRRECLANERSRNRMKGALTRFGVRGFKPDLGNAPERARATSRRDTPR
jgi:hypothetical protein